jgi:ferritin-like metal-binding protein YciE
MRNLVIVAPLLAGWEVWGLRFMSVRNLHDLLVRGLEQAFYVETAVARRLPKLAGRASSQALRAGFTRQIEEMEGHRSRLERIFHCIDETMWAKRCAGLEGLLLEAEFALDSDDPDVVDAALVATGSAIRQYEIARYGTLVAWADLLDHDEVTKLLSQTLSEKHAMLSAFASIADYDAAPKKLAA